MGQLSRRNVMSEQCRAWGACATTVCKMTAAVFDIDNTIVKGSTLYHVAMTLGRSGLVDLSALPRAIFEQYRYRLTAEEPEMDGIRRRALSAIEGLPIARLDEVLAGLGERILARATFPGSLALVNRHLESGDEVWLATAGPAELARQLAARLGLTGAIGTEVEVRDGHCTGALEGPLLHGKAKAEAVKKLGEQRGWDLTQVSTYSDSLRDLPLLRCGGRPNAVNPDRKLRRVATAEGWPVHDTAPRQSSTPLLLAGGLLVASRLWRNRSN
jgi:HAD superfamily hydrolase (TIGR01490 family)